MVWHRGERSHASGATIHALVRGIHHLGARGSSATHAQTRGYALVLNPIKFSETHTCRFSRVLIDGGSSINLLYRTSMEKLGIPAIQLNRPS
jgi:hypothetical protein